LLPAKYPSPSAINLIKNTHHLACGIRLRIGEKVIGKWAPYFQIKDHLRRNGVVAWWHSDATMRYTVLKLS
jgi:hypothetical protein